MRAIWLVIKHDIAVIFRQRSFWILSFLMPVILLAVNVFYAIQDEALGSGETAQEAGSSLAQMPTIGLVDQAGLIAKLPPGFPPDLFTRFPDEASARAALEGGELEQYVLLPADYVKTGEIRVYDRDFQILESGENMGVAYSSENEWLIPYLVNYNLTGDEQLTLALRNPTPGNLAERHVVRPAAESEQEGQALARVVATIVPYIFYFLLMIGSSYLMQSVVAEKENRTVEVLLLSLQPRQLMVGKILAMSVVILVQLAIWAAGGILAMNRGAELLKVAEFSFPPGFLVWAALFLVFGYLLFGSAMAASGAIAPNRREGGQMTWLLVLPLMPTLMFASMFVEQPNHLLIVILSLFPLSAPSAMVTRLAVAEVPLWQILVSLAGLAATAYLFMVLAARFFRAGNLLSSESFSWKRLAMGWRKAG